MEICVLLYLNKNINFKLLKYFKKQNINGVGLKFVRLKYTTEEEKENSINKGWLEEEEGLEDIEDILIK